MHIFEKKPSKRPALAQPSNQPTTNSTHSSKRLLLEPPRAPSMLPTHECAYPQPKNPPTGLRARPHARHPHSQKRISILTEGPPLPLPTAQKQNSTRISCYHYLLTMAKSLIISFKFGCVRQFSAYKPFLFGCIATKISRIFLLGLHAGTVACRRLLTHH